MPKLRKVAGAWRSGSARYRKVDGKWRRVKESYRKVDGRWVKTMSTPYIVPYIDNPVPDTTDVGLIFDDATKSYRAYVDSKPPSPYEVVTGLRILNLPEYATVSVELSTLNTRNVALSCQSGFGAIGGHIATTLPEYVTFTNVVGGEFTVIARYSSSMTHTGDLNFVLSGVKINGVQMTLP